MYISHALAGECLTFLIIDTSHYILTYSVFQYLDCLIFSIRPFLKQLVMKAIEDHWPTLSPLQPLANTPGGPLLVTMEGHRDLVACVAATITRNPANDDTLVIIIISSSWDKTLKTWDIKSTGVLKTFDGHLDKVFSVAITENGHHAVSGSADKTVR